MKKILHVIAQEPGKTGSGIFLKNIMRQAEKKGYSQALVAGIPCGSDIREYGLPGGIHFEPVRFGNGGLPFPVVGMSDEMPYESSRYGELTGNELALWEDAFDKRLKDAFEVFKPDIVMTHHLWLLTALVGERCGSLPVVAFSHGSDLRQMEKNRVYCSKVRKSCANIDKVLALNTFQKERIGECYGIPSDRIGITGAGYDGDCFNDRLGHGERKKDGIVYAGKISRSKGVESLLDAFEMIKEKRRGATLHLAGSGSGPEYEAIVARAESIPGVYITGRLDQPSLARLFNENSVFALPSFYEGLPLVLVEAAACGMRLLASRLGGLEEWIGEGMIRSGNAILVDLPGMHSVDRPLEEEKNDFARRIAEAAIGQINGFAGAIDESARNDFVDGKSWGNIFESIESQLPNK